MSDTDGPRPFTAEDFAKRMHRAVVECQEIDHTARRVITDGGGTTPPATCSS